MIANVGSQALTDLAYGNEFKYLVVAGAGFVGVPLSGILGYFDRVYRLNKLGLSPVDSFRYTF